MLCWIATFNTVETPVIDHIRIHHQIIQKRIMVSRFDSSRTSYQTSLSWDFLKFTRRIFARDLKKESGTFLRCSKHTECWTNEVDPTARCRVGTEGPFWKHGAPAVPARTPDWNKRKFKVFSPWILVREEVRRFIGSDEKRECPSPARSHFANDFSSRSVNSFVDNSNRDSGLQSARLDGGLSTIWHSELANLKPIRNNYERFPDNNFTADGMSYPRKGVIGKDIALEDKMDCLINFLQKKEGREPVVWVTEWRFMMI